MTSAPLFNPGESRASWRALLLLVTVASGAHHVALAQVANGFDLSNALIPHREIRGGGPPRDGIPALTDPARVPARQADTWLRDDDRVMGVTEAGEAMAYPIAILNWHEIVNDVVAGRAITVTYCPLCGTGVVFDATLGGERAIFGVSGLLYNSDVLLFDRRTESLFSQMMFQAVSGPLRGTRLQVLPSRTTTWAAWKREHPATLVLSRALPYGRDYNSDPYHFYRRSGTTMFSVKGADRSRNSKTLAWLVLSGDGAFVVADETLADQARGAAATFRPADGVRLDYDPEARSLQAHGVGEGTLPVIPGYWFALTAFHPDARELAAADLVRTEDTEYPNFSGPFED